MDNDPPDIFFTRLKTIFLCQVPIDGVFRYKKQFWKRASVGMAVAVDCPDVLDIDNLNNYDGVAVLTNVIEWD